MDTGGQPGGLSLMPSKTVGLNKPRGKREQTGSRPPAVESAHPLAFKPFIPAETKIRELTALPLVVGTLLGIVFGASSLYLVLKVGLTVSASIPVAVISI